MNRNRLIQVSLTLVAGLIIAAWLAFYFAPAPQNQTALLNRMIALQRWGLYDRAIHDVRQWMDNSRRDPSRDGLMYQQLAMLYIIKAYKRPSTKDASVRQADLSLQKELALYEHGPPREIDLTLFEIGRSYAVLGDISTTGRCDFYLKAKEMLARQLPLTKGDSYTAYGHTTRLDPVRADIKKNLEVATEKYQKEGCSP